MTIQIVQQRFVRHRHACWKARGAGRILQIANVIGISFGQFAIGRIAFGKILPAFALAALFLCRCFGHFSDFFWVEKHGWVRAAQLHSQLVDVAFLAAKAGWQWQWHWPCANIDAGAEQSCKFGASLCDQRNTVLFANPAGN